MVQRLEGSQVEDHGDHLLIRSPDEPGYWWGNAVLLSDRPGARRNRDWESLFTQHLPEAQHRAFGVDGVSGESEGCEDLVRLGCERELSDVMTATAVHEPAHPHPTAVCRPLDLTDPVDLDAALAVRWANAPSPLPAGYEEFLVRRMTTMRAVQLAGHGRWFGAFLDGEMRSGSVPSRSRSASSAPRHDNRPGPMPGTGGARPVGAEHVRRRVGETQRATMSPAVWVRARVRRAAASAQLTMFHHALT